MPNHDIVGRALPLQAGKASLAANRLARRHRFRAALAAHTRLALRLLVRSAIWRLIRNRTSPYSGNGPIQDRPLYDSRCRGESSDLPCQFPGGYCSLLSADCSLLDCYTGCTVIRRRFPSPLLSVVTSGLARSVRWTMRRSLGGIGSSTIGR